MLKNKKAVHPVVAVALLLVVAVLSVVGFQSWFSSFSTEILVSVEQDTNNQIPSDIYVEDLTTNKIYIKSHSGASIISEVSILAQNNTQMCINSTSFPVLKGLTTIDVSSCSLTRSNVYEVLITANNQLIENTQIAR
jgi:hypothetical protein